MRELINNYSGIFGIIFYSILFILYKMLKKNFKKSNSRHPLDENDEDALVACLTASIHHHNKTHKSVKIVSVREVYE